jgi:hypothetical protein
MNLWCKESAILLTTAVKEASSKENSKIVTEAYPKRHPSRTTQDTHLWDLKECHQSTPTLRCTPEVIVVHPSVDLPPQIREDHPQEQAQVSRTTRLAWEKVRRESQPSWAWIDLEPNSSRASRSCLIKDVRSRSHRATSILEMSVHNKKVGLR